LGLIRDATSALFKKFRGQNDKSPIKTKLLLLIQAKATNKNKQATNKKTNKQRPSLPGKGLRTMVIPLYLSAATIAFSFLFPPEQSETSSSSSRSVVSSSTMGGDRSFAYGVGKYS
jgi:hypothetical protein